SPPWRIVVPSASPPAYTYSWPRALTTAKLPEPSTISTAPPSTAVSLALLPAAIVFTCPAVTDAPTGAAPPDRTSTSNGASASVTVTEDALAKSPMAAVPATGSKTRISAAGPANVTVTVWAGSSSSHIAIQ